MSFFGRNLFIFINSSIFPLICYKLGVIAINNVCLLWHNLLEQARHKWYLYSFINRQQKCLISVVLWPPVFYLSASYVYQDIFVFLLTILSIKNFTLKEMKFYFFIASNLTLPEEFLKICAFFHLLLYTQILPMEFAC